MLGNSGWLFHARNPKLSQDAVGCCFLLSLIVVLAEFTDFEQLHPIVVAGCFVLHTPTMGLTGSVDIAAMNGLETYRRQQFY
jgi:hypothetical protein